MKQYLVIGGRVPSKNDRDIHYISPYRLCALYGLNPHARNVHLFESYKDERLREWDLNAPEVVVLRPRWTGNYKKVGE